MIVNKFILPTLACLLLVATATGKDVASAVKLSNTPAAIQIIKNKGQIIDQYGKHRKDIDFKIENNGVTMFGGKGQLHYQWTKENQKEKVKNKSDEHSKSSVEIYRLDVTLVAANPNAEVIFESPTGYFENYYQSQTPNGATSKGYSKITYKNIYPNIDWVVYTNSNVKSQNPKDEFATAIKYDFVVHPGGNPGNIRLQYDGTTELKLDNGILIAVTPYGTITENAPYSYNAASGKEVSSKYILQGNELSFYVGQYEGTIVIDPAIAWATYYGGTGDDRGTSVCVDIYENIYICGSTVSTGNIATTGAYQTTLIGSDFNGFIAKFDSSGSRLWGTYYGSSPGEVILGSISCDKWGNVFAAGTVDTAVNPSVLTTSGAHQVNKGGGLIGDAILIKLNTNGQRQWATLYGGNNAEINIVNTCDQQGNIYLAGTTASTNNVFGTSGTHKPGGTTVTSEDGFLTKFNTNGNRLWGTYYGGDTSIPSSTAVGADIVKALACDHAGNVYIGGQTASRDNIATMGVHQAVPAGGAEGFVAKINGANGTRLWGTYYGGNASDEVNNISVDADGNIYIAGATYSTNNIATTGAHQPVFLGGAGDAFIAKFNSAGSRQWGTYYGGTGNDYTGGLTMNIKGNLYVFGVTSSTSAIATTGSHQSNHGGGFNDAFIGEFSSSGQLTWASYYGGTGGELGPGSYLYTNMVAASNSGRLYMGGGTTSTNNIATSGSHQPTFTAGSSSNYADAFLVAWDIDTVVYIPQRYKDTVWCPGDTVKIGYGVNRAFGSGNNFSVQLSNSTGSFASPINIGTKAAVNKDTITCVIPINTAAGTGYRIRITGSSPTRVSWDDQWDIRIKAQPAAFSNTSNSPVCTGDTLRFLGSTSSTGISWAWTGPNSFASAAEDTFIANSAMSHAGDYILKATLNSTGCSLRDTTTVVMKQTPAKPVATSNSPVCETKTLTLSTSSSTSGVSYGWSGPGSYSSTSQNPTVTTSAASTHAGDYISTATLNGCSSRDTVTVVVLPKPAKPTPAAPNSPLCVKQDLQLTATSITGANYTWLGPSSFTANIQNPVRPYVQFNHAGNYYVYATVNGCISDTDSVAVVVNTDPVVNIFPTPGTTICPGQQAIFTALPTNGGTAPTYQWRINGIPTGGTNVSYNTTTLNNGDIVTCHMTSTTTCSAPFTDTSNAISMTVLPKMTPSVTISANPNSSLHPNEPISFTATPSNAGATPVYQWRRNGKNIGGATSATWGANANALANGDEICVLLKSSYQCPDPDTVLSNCIKLEIRLSIDNPALAGRMKLYPNPTTGSFTISSPVKIDKVEISNLLGQKLLTQNGHSTTMTIDLQKFAAGVYIIKVNDSYVERVVKE